MDKTKNIVAATRGLLCSAVAVALLASGPARAEVFHGVDFPGGISSFADAVASYNPAFSGGNVPTVPFQDTSQALGAPNYPEGADPEYVSLGAGGRIVVQFTNNFLTGSGNANLDLWIFEVGPDVEDTVVEISADGNTWFNVGLVAGATSGIDIDAFGFGIGTLFSFVRLTDVLNEGALTGTTVGADIDAVGAISTIARPTPEPGTLLLLGLGASMLAWRQRRSAR